jgi:hypothetical protein
MSQLVPNHSHVFDVLNGEQKKKKVTLKVLSHNRIIFILVCHILYCDLHIQDEMNAVE